MLYSTLSLRHPCWRAREDDCTACAQPKQRYAASQQAACLT
jgi:hypothetical protein